MSVAEEKKCLTCENRMKIQRAVRKGEIGYAGHLFEQNCKYCTHVGVVLTDRWEERTE